ncbi:unnamed protein product [Didymodactylos carnosus]|uniref:Dienelactone hydrolase domain-containing protein n=1 Tax=Didymodactylos carnosus TaxID=1234261 RepID=A0A814V8R8_9BILA|nr:unnamed protein product [Didymodactylos carnosus]CAF3949117.1 unnamed protein product [Didymodactylos carnosus]
MSGPCCVDPGAKQSHSAQGHEETVAGFNTYKTGQGNSVIVMFTDVFGHSFINTRKAADTFAQATGTTVLIPDFFKDDPMDPNESNLFDKLPGWLKQHPVDEVCASSDKFISTIKGHYDSIQVIGFCYGAKPVVHLISQAELTSVVKAAVVAHPSFLVREEATQIKRPILFLCAENDQLFTPDIREHFEKTLAPTGLATFINYPGMYHGFVIRPDGSEQADQQRDKAIQDAIKYFKKNV